jgi:hypothetical protein
MRRTSSMTSGCPWHEWVPADDQLGGDPVDVSALVGHDAVVPFLLWPVALDRDDRVGCSISF